MNLIISFIFTSLLASSLTFASGLVPNQTFQPGSREFKALNKSYEKYAKAKEINKKHKVVVAVIDSGVDYKHPNLKNHMHYNLKELKTTFDKKDNDNNTFKDDFLGYDFTGLDGLPYYAILGESGQRDPYLEQAAGGAHGTHVSGIVANNDERIGIIPFRVVPMADNAETKILQSRNPYERLAKMAAQYIKDSIYLAKTQGARVANLSLGLSASDEFLTQAHVKTIFKKLRKYISSAASNMIVVTAAGNESTDVSTGSIIQPCQLRTRNVLCVGSVDKKGVISSFSNYGIQHVDIYAPGEDIVSTIPVAYANDPTRAFDKMSGTSMASPYVAHVVARVLIEAPCLSSEEVINLLMKTAHVRKVKADRNIGNSNSSVLKYKIVNKKRAIEVAKNISCR